MNDPYAVLRGKRSRSLAKFDAYRQVQTNCDVQLTRHDGIYGGMQMQMALATSCIV